MVGVEVEVGDMVEVRGHETQNLTIPILINCFQR